jgi:hypothetical protein
VSNTYLLIVAAEAGPPLHVSKLAHESTSVCLESNTVSEADGWRNISEESMDDIDIFEEIEFSVRYLELRGLLVHHPENPRVKVLDQQT